MTENDALWTPTHFSPQKQFKIDEGVALADVDLVMGEGKTLTGRVLTADGAPVADAVLSVTTAWTPTGHIWWPTGLCPTEADGRFRLGLEAGAAGCHVRINSESRGQHFFLEVPVKDEPVDLTLQEPARVKGTITWADGTAASGLTVCVNGRLPEPPIPIARMGIRSYTVHAGLVGEDGTYAIEGLHPQLSYDIFVVDASLGEQDADKKPLTPSFREFFKLPAGEEKVWDRVIERPITIRGHIRTETSGTPVLEGKVGVRKDGERQGLISVWADEKGYFELHLTTGPGEYRLYAEPPVGLPSSEEVENLIDERFGKTIHLVRGDEVEVDLTIFEPMVMPVRVLDHVGEPAKTISSRLTVTFPNGRKMQHEAPWSLDEAGRRTFSFYHPAAELRLEISAVPGGPTVELPPCADVPGGVLGERTINLPRTCPLTVRLVDSSRKPHKERWANLRVIYEDGATAGFTSRTDVEGRLAENDRVRAAAFVVEIRSSASKVLWKSERLDGSAGNALDLGEIVLDWEGE